MGNNRIIPVHIGLPIEDQADALRYAAKHIDESGLGFMGHVTVEHKRAGKIIYRETGKNLFTIEGRAFILGVLFAAVDKPSDIYMGIFKNNVTPAAADTAAKLGAGNAYGECQDADYDPATNRPAYTGVVTDNECTNEAAKAEFVIKQGITVYGAFLTDYQPKTSTSGVLLCAKRFDNSRAVIADDELAVKYKITATSS